MKKGEGRTKWVKFPGRLDVTKQAEACRDAYNGPDFGPPTHTLVFKVKP